MDRLVGDPILGPKLLSFASTWLTAGLILIASLRVYRGGALGHILTAAGLLAFLLFDPVAIYTGGKTWNHEVPALLLILAVLFHVESLRRDSFVAIALSGAACGLAVGTRLTFLPCLLPLFGLTFFFPMKMRRRLAMATVFAGAVALSLAPSFYFFATARESFLFGNLEFPRLRLLDPENTRIQKTMTLWRKLRYFLKEIVLPSWPLFLTFTVVAIPAVRRRLGTTDPTRSGLLVVLWTAAFLILGCFLPSRYQYQHFYALIPLMVLGLALTGVESGDTSRSTWLSLGLALLAAISLSLAILRPVKGNDPFPVWAEITRPGEWFSARAATFGAELRRQLPDAASRGTGRILTLAPTWPIAAGLPIYPEFATGPFAWRSARFVAAERRSKFHLVAPDDLPTFLDAQPPSAILTGVADDDLEAPFIAYAQSHGFFPHQLSRKRQLWYR